MRFSYPLSVLSRFKLVLLVGFFLGGDIGCQRGKALGRKSRYKSPKETKNLMAA
jgi:hypothetical protein